MPTYKSELAGVSPVTEQPLPTESKYDLDKKRDVAKLHRLEARDIRLLDNSMIDYKQGELTETLWNPRDNILKQINAWNYKVISNEDAMHVPYKLAA